MTSLTILPYLDVQTHNLTKCSMDCLCTDCAGEEYDTEFDGEYAVRLWDSKGAFVAMMTYSELETDGFEARYAVEEIVVNVCGRTKLSTIIKQLCTYITELDDSIGTFDFECPVDYSLSLLLQEFCEFHTYTPSDEMMYFSYETK